MRAWRHAWTVARWEFGRHFKPKQQLAGVLITALSGLAGFGFFHLLDRERPVELAVVGDALELAPHLPERFEVETFPASEESTLRARVEEDELDGMLLLGDIDRAELVVRTRDGWIPDLETALASARRSEMLRRSDITPEVLGGILAPPELTVAETGREERRSGGMTLVLTLVVMLMAVFSGLGYMFSSITGEKQIRVTEQVVSAIPAQAWIDGKILGLIGVSLIGVASTGVGVLLIWPALELIGIDISLPMPTGDPVMVILIVVFGALGLMFWFTFLATVAAIIDDPNNSTRGPLLFVPVLATAAGFLAFSDPEGTAVRVLALVPATSPATMPGRMLLTDVPPLEVATSLLLLAGGVWLLRVVAGRIFRLAMLMYGKEPTWAELRRWMRTP